jgi:hypothetical protein
VQKESNGVVFDEDMSLGADGPYRLWVMPDREDRYVIGVDVAEGKEWGDYSDASVLSVLSGELVAKYHGRIDPDLFAEELVKLGKFYGNALIGVENNNHGLTVVTGLRHMNYPNMYRQQILDQVSRKQGIRYGWRTDKASKPLMIDELNRAIREHDIQVYDEPTLAELRTYVRDEKGAMHGSPHDDRVISLAIANQMRKVSFLPQYSDPTNDEWTFNWWARQGEPIGSSDPYAIGGHNVRTR